MNWKVIFGGFLSITSLMYIIYELLNWDGEFYEVGRNIIIAILGISMVIEGRKNRDDELMTDVEEKQVSEEFQGKVEEDEDGISFKFGVVSRYPI